MKILLQKMSQEGFFAFKNLIISDYAQAMFCGGLFSSTKSALEEAERKISALLPKGSGSPGHQLREIIAAKSTDSDFFKDQVIVGSLWYEFDAKHMQDKNPMSWIHYIHIQEKYRREGYAKKALLTLENDLWKQGGKAVGLTVFSHNLEARQLYQSLNYTDYETCKSKDFRSISYWKMSKNLSDPKLEIKVNPVTSF